MARYVRQGDNAAFDALFRRYAPRVHGLVRRGGVPEARAQELVQQTFLHVHRARRDFDLDRRVRPWLFTIATNVRREYFRRWQRRPEVAHDPETHREPSVAPDASTATDRLVRRALAELPDAQREVIELHWFEGLGFPEIAEILGLTTSAAKVRAHRGYERLRAALGPEAHVPAQDQQPHPDPHPSPQPNPK